MITPDIPLRDSGFLLVEGHGIDAGLRDRIRAEAREFFALPANRKASYATPVGGRGWIPQGGEANASTEKRPTPAATANAEPVVAGEWLLARAAAATVA
jgi:isopenicillin N synthase-like dioxygenase